MITDLTIGRMTRSALVVQINGRSLTIKGEALLPGYGPVFVIYPEGLTWDDGEPIGDEEARRILSDVVSRAKSEGFSIEVEWSAKEP